MRDLTAVQAPTEEAAPAGVFPIRGGHDMGQTATNNFGGARNHGGQDMFAACETGLVAAVSGVVQDKKYHSAAGNYIVIQDKTKKSDVYMHMASASPLNVGDSVEAGQPVGEVGQTGQASGCHLHLELWTAPGWYAGGSRIDPLPQLRQWESAPHSHNLRRIRSDCRFVVRAKIRSARRCGSASAERQPASPAGGTTRMMRSSCGLVRSP